MRTTIDLDAPILRDLKRLQKLEKKTLGQLVSELVASALATRKAHGTDQGGFKWISRPMAARVDLRDKDAVNQAMDRDTRDAKGHRR